MYRDASNSVVHEVDHILSQRVTSLNGLVGWLFWVKRTFETVFQSISGLLPKRKGKKREMIVEKKNVQTRPPTPGRIAREIGVCHTISQISRTPWHWKFSQHHRTTRHRLFKWNSPNSYPLLHPGIYAERCIAFRDLISKSYIGLGLYLA